MLPLISRRLRENSVRVYQDDKFVGTFLSSEVRAYAKC